MFQALDPGDHVVAPQGDVLGPAQLAATEATRWGLRGRFRRDRRSRRPRAAVRPGETKLVWIETPANPLWTITDIAAAAEIAHRAGARLAVDSTAASPVHTRPLALGADIVMHAATKILNGHSDVVAGALVGARQDAFWARVVDHPQGPGRDPRPVRGLSADARHAHAASARGALRPKALTDSGRAPRRRIRRSPACSIPACRSIPATTSPRGRWRAASAACCRSGSRAASAPRSRTAARVSCGSARPRSAASKA